MSNTTHNHQILTDLKLGHSITPMDALERYGCFRLGARIHDLKHGNYDGVKHDIETVMEKNTDGKGRHARYRLVRPMTEGEAEIAKELENWLDEYTCPVHPDIHTESGICPACQPLHPRFYHEPKAETKQPPLL